jgi:uncharacterized surface protein with fasciclin (FAS1) repeats
LDQLSFLSITAGFETNLILLERKMINTLKITAASSVIAIAASATAFAGGMKKDVVDAAIASDAHSTLVAAVTAAGLVDTLKGEGPFTVFAPVNDAFAALPEGTVDTLLKPESKDALTKVLTAHVVAGDIMSGDLVKMIGEADGGMLEIETVSGDTIVAMLDGDMVKLKDESGNIGTVTAVDLDQSNGVIHVVDTVLLPQ